MTNAEVAAFFAKLPPDEPARIVVCNVDVLGLALAGLRVCGDEEVSWGGDNTVTPSQVVGAVGVTGEDVIPDGE